MNLQSQEANAALALYPVYPPQWITPVQPAGLADGGIALSAFGPQGVMLVIDPITGLRTWTMAAFDTVTLYVNGVDTGVKETILPGKEGDRFAVYVPQHWFTEGVNVVHYKVTRFSGNEEDSLPLKLLYHNPAPTITVSHPASIGPGQPAVITFTLGYPRAYDTVTLTIGTWSIRFTHPDHTKPLTYTLTAADLKQIGDGTHLVSAVVVDQLTNSGVSPTTSVDISANRPVYNSPIIPEAEANGKVLDVAALKGKNATIHARTWTDMANKQPCWMRLEGFKADGSAHNLQLWNGLPAQTNPTWIEVGYYAQALLNSYLTALGDGKLLTIKFWASLNGNNNFREATAFPDQMYPVRAKLQRDFTDFTNGNWNGWTAGPGVRSGDLTLVNVDGNMRLQNYTYTNASSGVIIQKTFNNLDPTVSYRFTIKVVRFDGRYAVPRLSLRAAGATVAGPLDITSLSAWMTMSGTFTVSQPQAMLDVYSHLATGSGNDYQIDDIEIVRV